MGAIMINLPSTYAEVDLTSSYQLDLGSQTSIQFSWYAIFLSLYHLLMGVTNICLNKCGAGKVKNIETTTRHTPTTIRCVRTDAPAFGAESRIYIRATLLWMRVMASSVSGER
eukprot:scaffold16796_cov70-Attheya_sp.AAC.1